MNDHRPPSVHNSSFANKNAVKFLAERLVKQSESMGNPYVRELYENEVLLKLVEVVTGTEIDPDAWPSINDKPRLPGRTYLGMLSEAQWELIGEMREAFFEYGVRLIVRGKWGNANTVK